MRFPAGRGDVDNNVMQVDFRFRESALQDVDVARRIVQQERRSHRYHVSPTYPIPAVCRADADRRRRSVRSHGENHPHESECWDGVFVVNDKNDGGYYRSIFEGLGVFIEAADLFHANVLIKMDRTLVI